jgi:hypothetical protein
MLKDSGLNSHLYWKPLKLQFISRTGLLLSTQHDTLWSMNRQCFWPLKSLHLWYHCLSTHFKKQCQQEVKFEDCSLKCHYLDMKESSIFCVWDSESEQVLESHNCFVDEGITAYENIANIEVHRRRQLALAIMLSIFLLHSHLVVTTFFVSEECLHQLHCCFDSCYYSDQILHLLFQKEHLPLHIVSLNSWVQTCEF